MLRSVRRPNRECRGILLLWEDCVLQLLLLLLLRWWGKRCALPRDEMWLVQEALRRRGRFLRCDRHGVRGSPPLGSPTRRPPRPLQPRSPAPYRWSRSRSVLFKSIRRLNPWSTRAEGIDKKESCQERHFFCGADDERPRWREYHIRDRFVIGRQSWSIVDTEVRDNEQRPWRKKKMLPC